MVTALDDRPSTPLKIYPNPTADILQFETDMVVNGVTLMDATGRNYRIETETMDQGRYRLNLSSVPAGLYILRVGDGLRVEAQKVVIRR